MNIHLIRHGRTLANETGLYCGQTDVPLSDGGAGDILALKEQGVYPGAEVFYTSGLLRAEQTLDIIYGNVGRKAVPELAEYGFGRFEMKTHPELMEMDGYLDWINDKTGEVRCPGGESKNEFEGRVIKAYEGVLKEVRDSGKCSALIACHGGVIVRIMGYLFPDGRGYYEWQPVQGRGYTILYDPNPQGFYQGAKSYRGI